MYFFSPLSSLPSDVSGVPIFGPTHLLWLSCVMLIGIALVFVFRMASGSVRRRILRGAAWVLFLSELAVVVLKAGIGDFSLKTDLPLQLCDVMAFVTFYAVQEGKPMAKELCWRLGMPAAFFALLMPGETLYPFWNIFYLLFVLIHTLLFLLPVLLVADGFRPAARRLPTCFLCLLVLAAVDAVANFLFHGNYLFLVTGSAGSILELIQHQAGVWYLPVVSGLVWLIWGVQYGVFWVFLHFSGGFAHKRLD